MNYEADKAILKEKDKEGQYGNRENMVNFKKYGNSFAYSFSVFRF